MLRARRIDSKKECMTADPRDVLSSTSSNILRRAEQFEEVEGAPTEVLALAAIGLLRLIDESDLSKGYVITQLGIDVVQGRGPVRLADDADPLGSAGSAVS